MSNNVLKGREAASHAKSAGHDMSVGRTRIRRFALFGAHTARKIADRKAGAGHCCTAMNRRSAMLGASGFVAASVGHEMLFPGVSNAQIVPDPFCGVESVPAWAYAVKWDETLLSVQGHKLWVRSIGDAPKRGLFNLTKKTDPVGQTPVLCVHSGPGFSSRYMETIEFLGSYRRVIFYDMSGCGNSSAANGGYTPGIRSLGGYVDELQAVVERLGLEKVHLLGHGFGGMLALEAVAQARLPQLASLTLISTPVCYADLVRDRKRSLETLPPEAVSAIREADAMPGSVLTSSAFEEYLTRFVARRSKAGCLQISLGDCEPGVFDMFGPGYFSTGGSMADWTVSGRLGGEQLRRLPVLLARGVRDELSEASVRAVQKELPQATYIEVDKAGSAVFVDNWEPFLEDVKAHVEAADLAPQLA